MCFSPAMSRRSMRLLTNGYYRENGEIYNETHSPQQQVSYRESPLRGVRVFKKRTGSSRREVSSSNRFQVPAPPATAAAVSSVSAPSFSLGSMASEEQYSGVASALRAAVQSQSLNEVQTCGLSDEPLEPEPLLSEVPSVAALPDAPNITSGYSSSEETEVSRSSWNRNRKRIITRIRRSSSEYGGWAVCGDPDAEQPVEPGFTRVLFGGLLQLCCYILGLFRDVLLPSKDNQLVKRPILTLLTLTLLATGESFSYL
ncbi:uncharacterized protein LOC134446543 [Engraulis encrasicolus]|uniref:uncharacterized protein LOC134446543 n=1 Tax=Engraulis encrasicolus TaxID=184585 RepID=UPI002FD2C3EC